MVCVNGLLWAGNLFADSLPLFRVSGCWWGKVLGMRPIRASGIEPLVGTSGLSLGIGSGCWSELVRDGGSCW